MHLSPLTHLIFLATIQMGLYPDQPKNAATAGANKVTATSDRLEPANPEHFSESSKIRGWKEDLQVSSPGDFLSRLWAHFGKPMGVGYEGFAYLIRDKKTGLVFEAYSGASGPSYGGSSKDATALGPVLAEFDRWLAITTPADCEIEYETDFGTYLSGCKAGVPYDKPKNKQ